MLRNGVVHLYSFPQVTAFRHKLQVYRVNLVVVVGVFISKDKRERKVVAVVNDGPTSLGRNADVRRCDVVNAFEGFQTGTKRVAISLIFGVLEPEKNCVNEHGIR